MEKIFSQTIQKWYHENHRKLPWRETTDPYKIWLSEIILQQTQVKQGLSYYNKFVKIFPTVQDLAAAEQNKVLLLWQGLGYYSRARNLHTASKEICEQHNGVFPTVYKEILALKGVGDYTASAIASFAYKLPHAVVDGNVYRLLSRLFGIETPIDTTPGKREFSLLANKLLDQKSPDIHNQSIMEFGALQCKPKSPNCGNCPFQTTCSANASNSIDKLPLKSKKVKIRNRYFHYLKIFNGEMVAIEKREQGDIWAELYQFPLIETQKMIETEYLTELESWTTIFGNSKYEIVKRSDLITHQLSHQKLHCYFYEIDIIQNKTSLKFVPQVTLGNYAFPQLILNQL